MYINKVIIYGNLTRDPEVKVIPSGAKVCSFSLATNRIWKDKNGAKQEAVDFHNIVVFGRQAELVSQYLRKGSGALVEGRLQTRSWDGQDGQKKYRTEVVAMNIQFGPKSGGGSGNWSKGTTNSGGNSESDINSKVIPAEDPTQKDAPPLDTIEYPEEEINPDDIPF